MEIRRLSLVSSVNGADNIPIYDTGSGRTRAATLDQFKTYINPVTGMSFNNANRTLTLTMSDGMQLSVTIPSA